MTIQCPPRAPGATHPEPAPSDRTTDGDSLYVFIAYDDRPAYRRALGTLARVARELNEDGIELCPLPWRFDVLAEARCLEWAVADAAKAAIIVLSTSAVAAPPESLHPWLPACLETRSASAPAVLALLGDPEHLDGPDSPRYQFVRQVARQTGCDFIEPAPGVGAFTQTR